VNDAALPHKDKYGECQTNQNRDGNTDGHTYTCSFTSIGHICLTVRFPELENYSETEGMALDAKFFKRAKKANRAVEITDLEAVIPAAKDLPQVRVPLPNRRERTMEEREEILNKRKEDLAALEETIEDERKKLLALVEAYHGGAGAAEVVVQNLKIRDLMEQRRTIAYPEVTIKELEGITRKDIFDSKRDIRKVEGGCLVYQLAHRIEPIASLYVDLGAAAGAALMKAEEEDGRAAADAKAQAAQAKAQAAQAKAQATAARAAAAQVKSPEEAAKGAIIGTRKVIKLKKPTIPT